MIVTRSSRIAAGRSSTSSSSCRGAFTATRPAPLRRRVVSSFAAAASTARQQQLQQQAFQQAGEEQQLTAPHAWQRRAAALLAAGALALAPALPALAVDDDAPRVLCDAACAKALESKPAVTLPSGLSYKEIVEGSGASPQRGFQCVVNYVAMAESGRVFESSLERGAPYDIRIGAGQVIPGLDEGLATMRVGGVRRLFIPGPLAFTKPLKAAPGRPSVPGNTPVVFDVQLLLVPGLDDE